MINLNGWKGYIFLSGFFLMFVALLWIFPTDNLWFQILGTLAFSVMVFRSFRTAMKLKRNMDDSSMTIRHGKHKIQERRPIKTDGSLDFEFTFDKSHKYYNAANPKGMNDQINKLIGLSSAFIHKDSVRIGWRHSDKDRFVLFAYWYENGIRHSEYITNVKAGSLVQGSIKTFDQLHSIKAWIIINDQFLEVDINNICKWIVFPYFGGKHPAPWDMSFDIKLKY